jgi:hypothetical protein
MLFDMNSPRPVPFSDLVANFVNSLGMMSGSIYTGACVLHCNDDDDDIVAVPLRRYRHRVTLSVNFNALPSRVDPACIILSFFLCLPEHIDIFFCLSGQYNKFTSLPASWSL